MRETVSRSNVFSFPTWVDERAARTVAAGVVLLTGLYLLTGSVWILLAIATGFIARVAAGPSLSPLARLATQVVVPRLPGDPHMVPGTPKRFAQAIGATLSSLALVSHLAGSGTLALVLVAMIAGAAFLEAAFGLCIGCKMFARLMELGLIPADVCVACNDISGRLLTPSTDR